MLALQSRGVPHLDIEGSSVCQEVLWILHNLVRNGAQADPGWGNVGVLCWRRAHDTATRTYASGYHTHAWPVQVMALLDREAHRWVLMSGAGASGCGRARDASSRAGHKHT